MFDFEEVIKLVSEQTVVCIGDLMLDDFVYGEVSRISPEAPAPILAVTRNDLTVGGAGNTTISNPISVTIQNTDTTPPTSSKWKSFWK